MEFKFSDRISGLKPSAIREILKYSQDPGVISFSAGNPAPETFPSREMGAIAADIFANQSHKALQYGITEGYEPLRKQLFERCVNTYGFGTENDTLVICSGGQQAIELCCKSLCNEGDVVICEDPSFIGALNSFRSFNAKLVGVPMEADGMNIECLKAALEANKNAKIIYTIPNFQNPMGVCMSYEKRKALYALAVEYGVAIIEDNPYGDLRFSGSNIPSIKTLDTEGIVVYAGSFSKIISAGIRIGFFMAPSALAAKMIVCKQVGDVHTNLFFQMLISEYIEKYDLDAHIEDIRALYRSKAEKMASEIRKSIPSASFVMPQGGLFLWLDIPGMTGLEFGSLAIKNKVAVVPGESFLTNEKASCNAVRLNYSLPTFEQIEKGIAILGSLIKK